MFFNKI